MEITTFPRLHLQLISMSNQGYRKNGGIGFCINKPNLQLNFTPSSHTCINLKKFNCDLEKTKEVLCSIQKELDFKFGITINTDGQTPSHFGFGTGTSFSLACLEALFIVNNMEYNNETLIKLSGRGGTSGIGIHSYFSGGFVFDLGHKLNNTDKLKPSHAAKSPTPPLLLTREEMPDWPIGICIPKDIAPLNHKEERAFFDTTCPLNKEAVYEASYHALFGTLAAVKTQDYDAFCQSIRYIQECDWKKAERNLHGARLAFYEKQLYKAGADAVGMSSLGPSLFFMAKEPQIIIDKLIDLPCQFYDARMVNHGRVISDV